MLLPSIKFATGVKMAFWKRNWAKWNAIFYFIVGEVGIFFVKLKRGIYDFYSYVNVLLFGNVSSTIKWENLKDKEGPLVTKPLVYSLFANIVGWNF